MASFTYTYRTEGDQNRGRTLPRLAVRLADRDAIRLDAVSLAEEGRDGTGAVARQIAQTVGWDRGPLGQPLVELLSVVVVRPDQHVAWRARSAPVDTTAALASAVRTAFGGT